MVETKNLKLKRNLTALVEFSRVINSSIDLEFILNNVLLTCLGKFLATRGLIALAEKGKIVLKSSKGISREVGSMFPKIFAGETCLDNNELKSFMELANLKAAEKISSSEECIGLVCLGEKLNKTDYTEDDMEFLRTILNISATAIQNSIIINELRKVNRKLDLRVQRLNSLFELSKEFGLFTESSQIVKLLIFSLIGQFLISKYAIALFNEEGIEYLESKFEKEDLVKKIIHYEISRIDDSMTKNEIANGYPDLSMLGVELIVPLQLQGKTKGVILLGSRVNKMEYTDADIEFIYSVGNLAIISLENKRLFIEALEKQKMEEELFIARDIQRNLLPQTLPDYPGYDLSALNVSSKQVGGDYYDVIRLDEENFILAIADVSGKGVPASLMMANIQAFLQVICKQGMKLDEATALINDLITSNTTEGRFITFFWGIVNTKKNTFTYVNAGHNPPLLLNNGKIKLLDKGGMILGVMKTFTPYTFDEIKFNKNDVLIMYTDGVSEALSKDEEEFTEGRLEKVALLLKDKSADEILNGIKEEVQNFTEGNLQSDDITMIVMKINR